MIETCELCGSDFLTEADPYVVRPTSSGVKLYCYCQINGFEAMHVVIIKRLKAENEELRQTVDRLVKGD
jgi:hypothetical protein